MKRFVLILFVLVLSCPLCYAKKRVTERNDNGVRMIAAEPKRVYNRLGKDGTIALSMYIHESDTLFTLSLVVRKETYKGDEIIPGNHLYLRMEGGSTIILRNNTNDNGGIVYAGSVAFPIGNMAYAMPVNIMVNTAVYPVTPEELQRIIKENVSKIKIEMQSSEQVVNIINNKFSKVILWQLKDLHKYLQEHPYAGVAALDF